jgi:hypothetical protein
MLVFATSMGFVIRVETIELRPEDIKIEYWLRCSSVYIMVFLPEFIIIQENS